MIQQYCVLDDDSIALLKETKYTAAALTEKYTTLSSAIISAWCDRLFVISPTSKSGTLITADYAYKYHRQVTILKGDG